MAAQAQIEGGFLGGRPPYGYVMVDAGPHPNPAKAADGKRMHKLDLDPETAPVVRRIFAEFIGSRGFPPSRKARRETAFPVRQRTTRRATLTDPASRGPKAPSAPS
jgi:hypothetical protein